MNRQNDKNIFTHSPFWLYNLIQYCMDVIAAPDSLKHHKYKKAMIVLLPYAWLVLFFVIPFLFIFKISFTLPALNSPPYTALLTVIDQANIQIAISFENFIFLIQDNIYIYAYINSMKIAAISTILCLLIGYPIAYGITKIKSQIKLPILIMVVIPLWVPFLIRIYSWILILKPTGFLNIFLMKLGVIVEPLHLLYSDIAVFIGITYNYLPFMILPIFVSLDKIEQSLIEAAYDLGASPARAFWDITLPLSTPGIIAGSMLVFIPSVGEYVIPDLLGGSNTLMIGKLIWGEFFINQDWPIACAFATSLLVLLFIPIMILKYIQDRQG